jgi:hypothetical protein
MDVTIKGLPDGIQAQEVKEWVSVLVAVFRKANDLAAKFEVVEEPVEPKK